MVSKIYEFIQACWSWMPVSFVVMLTTLICIKFGDSLLGIIDRAWRILGR